MTGPLGNSEFCFPRMTLSRETMRFSGNKIHCSPRDQSLNAISAADIAFTMSSSTSAWLLSPLECSPQRQNG